MGISIDHIRCCLQNFQETSYEMQASGDQGSDLICFTGLRSHCSHACDSLLDSSNDMDVSAGIYLGPCLCQSILHAKLLDVRRVCVHANQIWPKARFDKCGIGAEDGVRKGLAVSHSHS